MTDKTELDRQVAARSRVRATTAAYKRAQAAEERARTAQRAAIVEAHAEGVRQVDLVRDAEFTREHIRRITEGTDEDATGTDGETDSDEDADADADADITALSA